MQVEGGTSGDFSVLNNVAYKECEN